MSTQTPDNAPAPAEAESADLFDYGLLRDYALYVLGSVRRHKVAVALTFGLVVAAAAGLLRGLPKTYLVETRLLAQRNQVIAALGNPGRALPFEADAPTRAAAETIMRRDNLVALIRQTNSIVEWKRNRAPLLRVKDWMLRLLRREQTEEDELNEIVGLLDKRLKVTTGEGTVDIAVEWPDAHSAYRLAEAAQRNFFEARHISESSAISEAISLLEGHAALLRERVDQAAEQLGKATGSSSSAQAQRAPKPPSSPRAAPPEDPEVARLKVMLDAKQREAKDLNDFRAQKLAELNTRMTELRAIYSPAHPLIIDLQERIDSLEKQESPQVAALRQDQHEIEADLTRRGVRTLSGEGSLAPARPAAGEIQRLEREVAKFDDPMVENVRGELRFALSKYATVLERIDNAHMELDAARAAFKYRYSVVRPAELPRSPIKPRPLPVMAAAVIAGLLFAVVLGTLLDLRRGLLLERWQVERQLGLPILVEVRMERA